MKILKKQYTLVSDSYKVCEFSDKSYLMYRLTAQLGNWLVYTNRKHNVDVPQTQNYLSSINTNLYFTQLQKHFSANEMQFPYCIHSAFFLSHIEVEK